MGLHNMFRLFRQVIRTFSIGAPRWIPAEKVGDNMFAALGLPVVAGILGSA